MKLTNMIMLMSGLMLLLFLAGINDSIGVTLGELGLGSDPTGIASSWLFTNLTLIISGAVVAGVTISFFTKTPAENLLIVPLVLFFIKFIADWTSLILITNGYCEAFTPPFASCAWITWVVVAIVVPISIGFAMASVDWWRGRD